MTECLLAAFLQCTSGAKLCLRSSCLFLCWPVEEVEIICGGEVWNKLIFLLEQYGRSEIPYL